MALVISYIAGNLVAKKHTLRKTFGFKRAEIIAAFINASTLIAIAIFLCFEAVKRLMEPAEIATTWVIGLAGLSIVLNGLSVWILHKDASHNLNIKSAYVHLLTDMFTSVTVLLGGIAMNLFKVYWLDSVLTFIIAVYLVYATWKILMDSLKMLMLFTPSNIEIDSIQNAIVGLPQISNIHHVHVWQLNDEEIHFEAHVDFDRDLSLQKVNEILAKIRDILIEKFNVTHVILQPEFGQHDKKDLISTHQ